MSARTVRVDNPDGTQTLVTMICVQDQTGNAARAADGPVDLRTCRYGAATPLWSPEVVGLLALIAAVIVFW